MTTTMPSRHDAVRGSLIVARRIATASLRFPAAHDITHQWLLGVGAVILAAALFLASALTLGMMIDHLRSQMETIERIQTVVLEAGAIAEDLADAHSAAQSAAADPTMLRIEGRNAARHLTGLMAIAPERARTLQSIADLVDGELAALAKGDSTSRAAGALAAFRDSQSVALVQARATAERDTARFIGFALLMALIGPALGLTGITLLQRERDNRRAREMEAELMHVQRLAVMGETAATLAHEVSHPLAAASNYLAAMRRAATAENGTKAGEFADRAVQQIHRAATILGRLRRFIEKRADERTPVAPVVLVQDAVALVGPLESDVVLSTAIDPDLPDVAVDRIQIQQVLVNLIRNATDAMQSSAMKRLTITAERRASGRVEFSLIDTGCGLTKDIADGLFQPFTTTKKNGMGVGLSICRSIIDSHNGTIWAEANPQGGAIFRFQLPTV